MPEANELKELKETLFDSPKHAAKSMSDEEIAEADRFCEGYKEYLNNAKTEREAVCETVKMADARGFKPFVAGTKYFAGDRVYYNNRGKELMLAVIGSEPVEKGIKIMAAHIDSPRVDLKPRPLFEDDELAFFKTHYYGGIKKYQWTAIPLSLHGVIFRKDGSSVTVRLGDEEGDPQFVITDLLPHLAKDQMTKPAKEAVSGEALNILVGSRPFDKSDEAQSVKLAVAKLLFEKYGIVERDFLSAELCLVPAYKPRDIGFDRSMIGAYGHDDKVCAYPAVMAELELETPEKTTVVILADKEEVGSDGSTGMQSRSFEWFVSELALMQGTNSGRVLAASECLSADVNAAFDPQYPEVMEKRNCCFLNYGVAIMKYSGSGGKYDTNDASAEFMSRVRRIMDDAGVVWQIGELGKVDAGGGGTVAKYIANLNADVVDVGVPVLSMHSPFEVVSKLDVYMTYRAFAAFADGKGK